MVRLSWSAMRWPLPSPMLYQKVSATYAPVCLSANQPSFRILPDLSPHLQRSTPGLVVFKKSQLYEAMSSIWMRTQLCQETQGILPSLLPCALGRFGTAKWALMKLQTHFPAILDNALGDATIKHTRLESHPPARMPIFSGGLDAFPAPIGVSRVDWVKFRARKWR
jgi:hypothetical protein